MTIKRYYYHLPKIHAVVFILSLSSFFISEDIEKGFFKSNCETLTLQISSEEFGTSKKSFVVCMWSNSVSVVSINSEGSIPVDAIHFATISDTEPSYEIILLYNIT